VSRWAAQRPQGFSLKANIARGCCPVTYPGNRPAIECIGSTAALYLVYAVQRAVVLVAYKYNRVHWNSPSEGAVRDSRSMASGQ